MGGERQFGDDDYFALNFVQLFKITLELLLGNYLFEV
jgi:hypothetical protein